MDFNDDHILHQVPGFVGWKGTDLTYKGASGSLLRKFGLCYQQDLLGHSDDSLNKNTPQENAMFHQQDILALSGKTQKVIHFLENDGSDSVYFLSKGPLKKSGKIVGIIYHCLDWPEPNVIHLLKQVDKKFWMAQPDNIYYSLDQLHNSKRLSKRELECLFLLLRSKTAKQIGGILGLSIRTIESYIDSIKVKFGCFSKSELIISAMTLNYHRHIPKRFTGQDLLMILKA